MPKHTGVPIGDDERQRILSLLPSGKSCRAIAAEVGRSRTTVSKVAREVGHVWGATNVARAAEANRAYGAEWRADFAKRLAAKCDDLLSSMDGEYLVYNFGGRDNTYEEHTLEGPPTEAKERLVKSIRLAMQTVLDIDRHDRTDDEMAVVDDWLTALKRDR